MRRVCAGGKALLWPPGEGHALQPTSRRGRCRRRRRREQRRGRWLQLRGHGLSRTATGSATGCRRSGLAGGRIRAQAPPRLTLNGPRLHPPQTLVQTHARRASPREAHRHSQKRSPWSQQAAPGSRQAAPAAPTTPPEVSAHPVCLASRERRVKAGGELDRKWAITKSSEGSRPWATGEPGSSTAEEAIDGPLRQKRGLHAAAAPTSTRGRENERSTGCKFRTVSLMQNIPGLGTAIGDGPFLEISR